MDRCDFLKSFALLTGSVAFGVATEKSDTDYLIPFGRVSEWEDNYSDGLEESGSMNEELGGLFKTYRDPETNENYIVALTPDFESRWRTAHAKCVELKPAEKKERIRVFRHYLYDEPLAAGGER